RLMQLMLCLGITGLAWAQDSGGARFAVSSYTVAGDNPLSASDTQALHAPYTGDAIGIDRLPAAAAALEEAIKDQGYSFMRVVIPPQDAKGVITLRVLAFRLGEVIVEGNRSFDRANILGSLPALRPGDSPNLREVARNQAQVNDHPAKQVAV